MFILRVQGNDISPPRRGGAGSALSITRKIKYDYLISVSGIDHQIRSKT